MKLIERHIDGQIRRALDEFRVVTVLGARQVGKTTIVRSIADEMVESNYVTLDSDAIQQAALSDPQAFLADAGQTMVIDEIQRAPKLLLAIKERVDNDNRRGQFLVTGSANLLDLKQVPDTLPGRNVFVRLRGLSQAEMLRLGANFKDRSETVIDMFFKGEIPRLNCEAIGIGAHLRAIARGGFPEAQTQSASSLGKFFDSYIEASLNRHVDDIARIDSKSNLNRVLSQIAARSSGLFSASDIGRGAGVSQHTAERYVRVLRDLFLVEILPAWSRNIDQRQIRMPKAYVADSGLHSNLVGLDPLSIDSTRYGVELGQMFESFVVNEALKINDLCDLPAAAFHYRDRDRHEVDLLFERRNGDVVAIEVKTTATVVAKDFRGLRKLGERLGDQLKAGVVFYTGAQTIPFGPRLAALPVSALWE